MPDTVWCEQYNIPVSSFYNANAVTKLRKATCVITESAALFDRTYALDFTFHWDVVRVNIGRDPEATIDHTDMPMAAAHLDNPHMIELMTGRITVKISNSVYPGLLETVFRLLRAAILADISSVDAVHIVCGL